MASPVVEDRERIDNCFLALLEARASTSHSEIRNLTQPIMEYPVIPDFAIVRKSTNITKAVGEVKIRVQDLLMNSSMEY
ncbi:hypothetical protein N7481_011778 [Penicillium waksmanii]|uniref:uncharacterized protein n=1 Tax=Penicillium waksmanii TaxID=69791 RepID=UPI00254861DE|nr:uncharacterized protein N7481_011778 [Penicillium waksmanii]KAJ5974568.1 hypothetical protein N7481_011778 [Penicillium waksmanii]